MGTKKKGIIDRIKEGDQIGKEGIEAGEQLECDGREIKSLLDAIDTSMDEDDIAAVQKAESGYDVDTKTAFEEEVESKKDVMEDIESEVADTSVEELNKVNDATDKFEEMSGITDIGRSNAEGAADSMRDSAAEYEDFVAEANSIIEDTRSAMESLGTSIENIFG